MRRLRALALALALLIPAQAFSQAFALATIPGEVALSGPGVSFLRDPGGELSASFVAGLPSARWTPLHGAASFGYTRDVIWLRTTLQNDADAALLYLTEHHGVDEFTVYQRAPGTSALAMAGSSGWAPSPQRGTTQAGPGIASVAFRAAPGTQTELFIRLLSSSSLNPRFVVMAGDRYLRETRGTVLIQGLATGFAAMLVIMGILLHIAVRGQLTVFYLLLTAVAMFLVLYTTGLGPLALWRSTPGLVPLLGRLSTVGTLALSVVVIRSMLIAPSDTSLLARTVRALQWIALALLGLGIVLPARFAFPLVSVAMLSFAPVLFLVLVWARIERRAHAGSLLIAWSTVLLVALSQGLVNLAAVAPPRLLSNLGLGTGVAIALQNAVLAGLIVRRTETAMERERSRRKQAEASAQAAQEQIIVADRMRGLDYLVSGVTHELGNTLGAARQISELIKTEARWQRAGDSATHPRHSAPPATAVNPLDFAAAVEENAAFVEEQLAISAKLVVSMKRIARDEARTQLETTDICGLIQDIARSSQVGNDVKGARHRILTECQSPLNITTSPGALAQILLNLVSNAVRHGLYGQTGGIVTLRAHREAGMNGFPSELVVSVEDNGTGVPQAIRERIFDLYFTTAIDRGGSGLGLSICRTLAQERLGGSLTLENPADGGARFVLRIPDPGSGS